MPTSDELTCPADGAPMVGRPGTTPEQRWCGEWFDCSRPGCRNSELIASAELASAHAAQRKDR